MKTKMRRQLKAERVARRKPGTLPDIADAKNADSLSPIDAELARSSDTKVTDFPSPIVADPAGSSDTKVNDFSPPTVTQRVGAADMKDADSYHPKMAASGEEADAEANASPLSDPNWISCLQELTKDAKTVACYWAVSPEPATAHLLSWWQERGTRVLLPVLHHEPDWAWFTGTDYMHIGPHGIREPVESPLGADILATAEWIVVPGLAGTVKGERLGTGGGWYDRALLHSSTSSKTVLLIYENEVLESLPTDSWDLRVDYIATEARLIDCRLRKSIWYVVN